MSNQIKPSACVVFFGVRYLTEQKVDKKADALAQAAEKHGLDVAVGRRYPPPEKAEPSHFLLIGTELHEVGFDGSCERSAKRGEVRKAMQATATKLAKAGITDTPALWIQCKFD